MLGMFSILQTPSESIVAGSTATAAFLAPLIETLPASRLPPDIIIFSKIQHLSTATEKICNALFFAIFNNFNLICQKQ
jgi:hypothetical protein